MQNRGDFNRIPITDILDSYGALHQAIFVPTRESATLEIILTDLHTLFYPPTTLPPLQVDTDKDGQDSDHNVVVFAPKSNNQYRVDIKKKTVKTRPLPESNIWKYKTELANHPWNEVFEGKSVDEKVEIFHNFLRNRLENSSLKKPQKS